MQQVLEKQKAESSLVTILFQKPLEKELLPFIAVTSTGNSTFPDVAVDPAGNAVAVWFSQIGPDIFIQSATLAFGASSWSSITTLTQSGALAFDPRVAVDAAG